jgi:hypothetical protein
VKSLFGVKKSEKEFEKLTLAAVGLSCAKYNEIKILTKLTNSTITKRFSNQIIYCTVIHFQNLY